MRSRSKGFLLAGVSVLLLVGVSTPAVAAETAASELVIISEGDTVEGDLYAAGVRVLIEGVVDGDLIAFAAEEVLISGEVTGSVLAVAPAVDLSGDVGEAMRVTANTLEVSGSVGTDLVGTIITADLDPGSQVQGDVLLWAINASAAGNIGANLEGTQRSLELEGMVGGDVDVSVRQLSITGPLEVAGDLGYRSGTEAEGLEQATVGGVVVHKAPLPPNIRVRALGLLARFLAVLGLTTAAVLVAWGWPERTKRAGAHVRRQILRSWGYGAVVMLSPMLLAALAALLAGLAPAAGSLPLLAVFGPLVVVAIVIVLALSVVAGVPAVLGLGEALPGNFGLFGSILIGSALVGIVWMIPLVGWVVPLLVLPIGLGAWMLSFRGEPEPEPA
jgi:cytoskeletal protein CcmA (bactofilin family)